MEWHDLPLDVVGLDWRLPIDEARARGITKAVQGNLDPSLLLSSLGLKLKNVQKKLLDQGMAAARSYL